MADRTDELLKNLAADINKEMGEHPNGGRVGAPFGAPKPKRIDLVEASAASADAMGKIFDQAASDVEESFRTYELHANDLQNKLEEAKQAIAAETESARQEAQERARWLREQATTTAAVIAEAINRAAKLSAMHRDMMTATEPKQEEAS